jgi:5-methyltetrahydrofolate corrinoid/iron sulfur protein methyltransferase
MGRTQDEEASYTMMLVADNLQLTRPDLAAALAAHDPAPFQAVVRQLEAAGAEALDLNTGPLGRHAARDMAFCITAVQAATDLPILIDTANPLAMKAGLEASRKTVVINGVSLEPRKLEAILPLAAEHGVDVVLYLLDGRSQMPRHLDDRLSIALALYQHCRSMGLPSERLIIDPVVAPLIWQDGLQRNRDLLEIVRRLPELLDFPVRTVAGLSNLTTGKGPRDLKQRLEQAYLCMLTAAGLSWILLDIHRRGTVAFAHCCRMLLESPIFAWQAARE